MEGSLVPRKVLNMPDKIYKVFHTLIKNGGKSLVINDLQYDEGKPYVVLGWLNTQEGRMPSFRVPLDPKYLLASKLKEFDYVYQIPVSFPF